MGVATMNGRILVMGEDPASALATHRALAEAGYEVTVVFDGGACLKTAQAQCPDLVVLDLAFPGTDGVRVCGRLKSDPQCAQIPVLVLVDAFDSAEEKDGEGAWAWQPDGFAVKPLAEGALLQQVRGLLGGPALGEIPSASPQTILVIDDDPQSVDAARRASEPQGHQVVQAVSVDQGLKLVASLQPDLVFLGTMLSAAGGLNLVPQIRALDPELPVVVMIPPGLEELVVEALEEEADGFVFKPLGMGELQGVMRTHLGMRQLQKQRQGFALQARESGLRLLERYIALARRHERLQQSYARLENKDVMREDLFEMAIHDLRNPLGVIVGTLELLGEELGDIVPPDLRSVLNSAEGGAHQMLTLVDNLLGIQRLEEGKAPVDRSEVDLLGLLRTTLRLMKPRGEEKGLALVDELPAELPLVWADWNILTRVVVNLLDNAIKFTPSGGTITLSASAREAEVQVTVADTGVGIAPEDQDRVFEKFERVREPGRPHEVGTGLGLAFCKLALEAHGGRIWVQSKEGAGSQFAFTLPTSKESGTSRPEG